MKTVLVLSINMEALPQVQSSAIDLAEFTRRAICFSVNACIYIETAEENYLNAIGDDPT